jgi:16S rRNA C1402 (ribose-2'-O) methylase RsmI
VADPGARLVLAAHAAGIVVEPFIGPSALLLALMGSGLDGQRFAFAGYLPTQPNERRDRLQALEQRSEFYNREGVYLIQEMSVEILKTLAVRWRIYTEDVRGNACVEKLLEILFFQTAHGIEQHPLMRLLFKDMPAE